MEPLCYLNGEIVPLKSAGVGIQDLGILRGFGIYEGITAFSGEPFHLEDHWKRFEDSARELGLHIPASREEVRLAMRELIAKNTVGARANLRMVLTGGEALGGIEHRPGRETFFITAETADPIPETVYASGGTLITHEHRRFLPEAKTINYITAVVLQRARRQAGAIEILYTAGDTVLECATSNICIVKNGAVLTPRDHILKGVTRAVVLAIARETGLPIKEREITLDEVLGADEVFITSSFKDVLPIARINDTIIGSGAPGPVTRALMKHFADYAKYTVEARTSIV